jgi:hypothetical protein
MSLLDDIESLAQTVAKKAQQDATGLSEMVEALKTLSPYYTLLTKQKPPPDDGEDNTSIADIQRHLKVVEDQQDGAAVRSRNGRS